MILRIIISENKSHFLLFGFLKKISNSIQRYLFKNIIDSKGVRLLALFHHQLCENRIQLDTFRADYFDETIIFHPSNNDQFFIANFS